MYTVIQTSQVLAWQINEGECPCCGGCEVIEPSRIATYEGDASDVEDWSLITDLLGDTSMLLEIPEVNRLIIIDPMEAYHANPKRENLRNRNAPNA